jgi:NADP-dependent 3-hydroxy acid dehydrogenase YdfG
MRDLNGKVAWITGAGSGIGRAAAEALAGAGVAVVLSGRRAEPLDETAQAITAAGGAASVEPLDVLDAGAVRAVAGRIGAVDILVNNAGLNVAKRHWEDISDDAFDQVVGVNLNGAFYCARAVLPAMRAQGDGLIVNISSWAGRYDSPITGPAYNAAKHGLRAMNATINMDEGPNGIRACAICPAEVATPIMDSRPEPPSAEVRARMLRSEDLGETVLFVARMPAHACVNEILISPTWNRAYPRMMDAPTE